MNTAVDPGRRGTSRFAERLAEIVGASAGASSVFGDAIERDGITVIPVARSRWGFGGGDGEAKGGTGETGSGGGGGALVRPLGFIEISGGRARFRRIVDPAAVTAVLLAAIALGLLATRRHRTRRERIGGCARRASRRQEPTVTVAGNAPAERLDDDEAAPTLEMT